MPVNDRATPWKAYSQSKEHYTVQMPLALFNHSLIQKQWVLPG